jgi:hypothetical protein
MIALRLPRSKSFNTERSRCSVAVWRQVWRRSFRMMCESMMRWSGKENKVQHGILHPAASGRSRLLRFRTPILYGLCCEGDKGLSRCSAICDSPSSSVIPACSNEDGSVAPGWFVQSNRSPGEAEYLILTMEVEKKRWVFYARTRTIQVLADLPDHGSGIPD